MKNDPKVLNKNHVLQEKSYLFMKKKKRVNFHVWILGIIS